MFFSEYEIYKSCTYADARKDMTVNSAGYLKLLLSSLKNVCKFHLARPGFEPCSHGSSKPFY
jgi:hypothetical protein